MGGRLGMWAGGGGGRCSIDPALPHTDAHPITRHIVPLSHTPTQSHTPTSASQINTYVRTRACTQSHLDLVGLGGHGFLVLASLSDMRCGVRGSGCRVWGAFGVEAARGGQGNVGVDGDADGGKALAERTRCIYTHTGMDVNTHARACARIPCSPRR